MTDADATSELTKWIVLLAVCIGIFTVAFNTTAVMNALPHIMHDLNLKGSAVEWAINAYMLGLATLVTIGGKMGDIFPRRNVYYFGGTGFMIASAIVALSGDTTWLIIGRALQGIFIAFLMPTSLTIIKVNFPDPNKQKVAVGFWAAMISLGFAFGPIVSGILIDISSWRVTFWINLPIIIVSFIILFFIKAKPCIGAKFPKIDYLGLLLLIVSIFCFVLGLTEGSNWGWSNWITWVFILGGLALFVVFFFVEQRSSQPTIHFETFKNSHFSVSMILLFATFYSIISLLYFYNLYIQNDAILDFRALDAGLSLLPAALPLFFLSLIFPKICIRYGLRIPMMLCFSCLGAGFLWFSFITIHSTYTVLWFPLLLIGIGLGGTFPTLPGSAITKLPPELAGEASGLISITMYISAIITTAIGSLFYTFTSYDTLHAGLEKLGPLPKPTVDFVCREVTAGLMPLKTVLMHLPIGMQAPATKLAREAGTYSFNNAMLVAAIIAFIAALISLCFIKDDEE